MVVLKRTISGTALCCMLITLLGCGAGSSAADQTEAVQTRFNTLQSATFHAKILSDLGQSTLEYEVDYAYNKEDSDTLSITAPEPLRGITANIAGQDPPEMTLQYAETILDAPGATRPGLTPSDVLPCLLYDLRASAPIAVWSEKADGTALTVVKFSEDSGAIEKQVWLTEKGYIPVCAELYAQGQRVLQCTFSDFKEP